jgi:TPR repeat protein
MKLFSRRMENVARGCVFAGLALISLLGAAWATAQERPGDATASSCISPEMARQIVQEGGGVRVDAPRNGANQAARENAVGVRAVQGPETAQTMREARKQFVKAARRGYAPAQVNLAVLSLAGWGAPPNAGETLYRLHAAAQQGYPAAIFDLGIMYLEGCGVRRDYVEAFRYFEKGAQGGDPAAEMNLGYLYDYGLGVEQNRSAAAKWYRQAADQGEPRAQFNLGDLYLRGDGVPHDESAAFAWFQKAAVVGYAEARVMLGSMYAAGRGTPADPAAAYIWLAAAAIDGDVRVDAKLEALRALMTPEQIEEATVRVRSIARVLKPALQQSLLH